MIACVMCLMLGAAFGILTAALLSANKDDER